MKKLLLASTALVATAGVASAQDIALTGMAEMGIFNSNTEDRNAEFFTDIDVTFTMTGEADNGLTFGASIDLDESDASATDVSSPAFDPEDQGGESIFVSFGGATLTMGDTDGALDARVPEMALAGGSLADDETTHAGFNDGANADGLGDGQIARFDYTFGSFTASISVEQVFDGQDVSFFVADSLPDGTPIVLDIDGENATYGIGFSYAANVSGIDLNTGIAYQAHEDVGSETAIAVTGGLANGLSLGVTYSGYEFEESDDSGSHVGVGIGYEMNALAVGLNYGEYHYDDEHVSSGYGLAATYDLGGGLELRGGYSHNAFEGADDFNTFSLGARMNF